MLHERSNITASFAKHLKPHAFGLIVANQNKKTIPFDKCYIQGAPRTKQYHWFLGGAPKISRINAFYEYTLGK